ncbi:MBL fold metallo-hydrolase [Bacillus infantis]|uniref:MBL fold metallo-hydrolase n=1 Tax=Bacillus infantis TaxID=324767 RepID=UPI001CD43926|nr:MBL fold metallo-hydrolase [Bacillus infantis]MCA1040585.1 MBL fold metallo-hydrolase [Bacillus infantis]
MLIHKDQNTAIFQSSLFKTNSAVIQTEDLVLVIDPCWLPHEIEEIRSYAYRTAGSRPIFVLYTHSDYDHIIGHGSFPDATIIASKALNEKDGQEREKIIEQILAWDDSYYIDRDYTPSYPAADIVISQDGQTLAVGGTELKFFQTPGHTDCGIACIIPSLDLLIAGDYLCDTEFPYVYFSSTDYLLTLEKFADSLADHSFSLMMTGHGLPAYSNEEISSRIQSSAGYLAKLKEYVAEGKAAESYVLFEDYKYPRIMKDFHDGNIELMKKEFGN